MPLRTYYLKGLGMPDILIVDDDTVDRMQIKRFLARPGREIAFSEAVTGQEGLDMLLKKPFSCVFLDYRLPDMDGIAFLRKMYNTDTDLTLAPVVMLTGQGSEGIMADALRWGAQDYLIKDNISTDTLDIAMAKARELFELKKSRRQAEDQLRQAQKMEAVGQLTSGVAHDFNNLLTVILGNTRLLQKRLANEDGDFSREDIAKKIEVIETAARKGAELIRRLMIFTRQRPLRLERTNINTCVQTACDLLQRSLGSLIEVKYVLAEELWPVQIDVDQFENALINIAINARDAMPKGGKLTLETHNMVLDEEYARRYPDVVPGPYAMVAISDTGTGIPTSVIRRIFEPFFTTKAAGDGTGLGLSMVYGFIKQSSGYIHVYSEEGHGTVFRIYLPRIPSEAEGTQPVPINNDALPRGTETILVVEDDDDVRNVVVSMLERLGYNIIAAQNGRMALEFLKRDHKNIHLMFVDIVMPGGMNGVELAQKAREYYSGLKVLFTSGYTENAIPDYQLISGQDLIGKPYRRDALARKIRQVLDGGNK
jgi:signal transduction histidine kinase